MNHTTDIDLETSDILELGSLDAIASFFNRLGYNTDRRAAFTPESIGLSGDAAKGLKKIELLSEDSEGFLRVVFAQSKSLTAKVRNDLARVLGKSTTDHLIILTSDYLTLEFVLLDKRQKQAKGPAGILRVQVVPKTISVDRRSATRLDLRIIRRLTWTCQDALDQFDKLRSVFDAAACTGRYFQNRGLFSDYFLHERLYKDEHWGDNPSDMFSHVRDFMQNAAKRWADKDKDVVRKEIFAPIFKQLGFKPRVNRPSKTDQTQPDYLLEDTNDNLLTAAFVYQWDRWLDGPDLNDPDTPEENPGACVVSALDEGIVDWIIVTNGRHWRLYGKQAHARSTNFYEVDLIEALLATGDTDPNDAFRYWWLFFRQEAYTTVDEKCWLDMILQGSRDYAKRLGDRLKDRVFLTIFPHLAQGFLSDRKRRLAITKKPTEDELGEIFEATLTLLYRLLFLLYAESRGLVPINEAPYQAASLKKIKGMIAEKAGGAESEVADAIKKNYSATEFNIYDELTRLFHVMAEGDASLNVPKYNGGLFNTTPTKKRAESVSYEDRSHRIGQFLIDHKIPDRQLALAIDRLSRDQDERTLALAFIDYKSLEVRHLGSIYEGLLEFKLKVASEDLTTMTKNGKEKLISLSEVSARRRSSAEVVVKKNVVYLSNDKAERKASGAYYTPDPIVSYIVSNTVGPVLDEKLETLRPEFRKVRKTFNNELKKASIAPIPQAILSDELDERQWANLKMYQAHEVLIEQMFDFHVCDPAMGSGHFLVEVVDFVTDRMLKFLNQFPINPVNYALERTRSSIIKSLGEQGVTVDPDNLTDINLLKRHVLKRCIYGVDVNPMAVELAKVSLWLDCFTLGAPLNFLDHHLRCGNSLIGATFEDLKNATTGRLFKINYKPLLTAIDRVLQVSNLADATSAEVATSVTEYDTARQSLMGYQIVLDLLVAKHFGYKTAPGIVEQGQDIKLSTQDKFLASLEDDDERHLVLEVEALAKQASRRFFHWEIEFPEIFFGFIDENQQRQIRHKNTIADGLAGFDCVVGNPPYISALDLSKILGKFEKPFWKTCFKSAEGAYDIYVLFIELATRIAKSNGYSGLITPNKYLSSPYGKSLRRLLVDEWSLVRLYDVSRAPVFDDPSVYPVISIVKRSREGESHTINVDQSIGTLLSKTEHHHDRTLLKLLPEYILGFLLSEGIGVLTHIQSSTKQFSTICRINASSTASESDEYGETLIEEREAKGGEGWRVVNTGLIDPYRINWGEKTLRHSGTIFDEPWLPDSNIVSVNRREQYSQAKLIFAKMVKELEVAFDAEGVFAGLNVNFAFVESDAGYFYIAILNSSLMTWIYSQFFGALRMSGGYFQVQSPQIRVLPVLDYDDWKDLEATGRLVKLSRQACDAGKGEIDNLMSEIDDIVFNLYGVTEKQRQLIDSIK
ncbi:Eco57I restriction-modification methylase domain-containing protein [Gimesia maris]|uniref:Eco57I restriction-modification methylase domain-containing protein n=1 Tax=Gimesia maris TaxID=122 RepID=UPI003A8E4265